MMAEFSIEELKIISTALSRNIGQLLKMGFSEDRVSKLIETHDYVKLLLLDAVNNG